jgi:DNA-binding transcriptional LysR family regulator
LSKIEIRMTGSMSPRAKATLAAMRMAFKLANIARSFDIGHLAAFRARFERRAARLMLGPQHRSALLLKYASCLGAMRVGEIKDASLVARHSGIAVRVAAAAPSYIKRHGEPSSPADLANHTCIVHGVGPNSDVWTFVTPDGSKDFRVSGGFLANDVRAVHIAARTGYGIAYLALFEVFDDLRSGRLVRVLRDFPAPGVPYSLVYPSRRHLAPRTRLVMDFIWAQLRQAQAELATASDEARTA